MPGPDDYPYVHEDQEAAVNLTTDLTETQVSEADLNPAFYPPEAKSEALWSEADKEAMAQKEEVNKEAQSSGGAVSGEKEEVVEAPQDEESKTAAARNQANAGAKGSK